MKHFGTFLVLCALVLDYTITGIHQPVGYWTGNAGPDEGNPIVELVMLVHPVVAILVGILYFSFVALLMVKMSHPYKFVAGSVIFTAHTHGALLWLLLYYGINVTLSSPIIISLNIIGFGIVLAAVLLWLKNK